MVATHARRVGLSQARHREQDHREMFETIGDIRRSYASRSGGDSVNKKAV